MCEVQEEVDSWAMLQALSRHLSAIFRPTHTNIYAHKHRCNRSQNRILATLELHIRLGAPVRREENFPCWSHQPGAQGCRKEDPSASAILFLNYLDGLGDWQRPVHQWIVNKDSEGNRRMRRKKKSLYRHPSQAALQTNYLVFSSAFTMC